jgi:hypothetical protein
MAVNPKSDSLARFISPDALLREMVSTHSVVKQLGKASRTTYFNDDGSVKSRAYDFNGLVPDGLPSRVIFDVEGNVVYPERSTVIEKRLRVLPTAKITRDMDYDDEFKHHKSSEVHLYMPQGSEMYRLENFIIRRFFKRDSIRPVLIHGPGVDVSHKEFLGALAFMRGNYGADTFTLHPLREDYGTARAKLEEYHKDIVNMGVRIAYENMDATDRWLRFPQEIVEMNLPNIGLTLDTSHLPKDTDLSDLLDQIFDKLWVVHLSNQRGKNKHLPYRDGEMNLSAFVSQLKSNGFKGSIVLEYNPQYEDKCADDLMRLKDMLF